MAALVQPCHQLINVALCQGGWIEWGARKDSFGQALYVEHWARLPKGEAGPHLALRRACFITVCRGPLRSGFRKLRDRMIVIASVRLQGVRPRARTGYFSWSMTTSSYSMTDQVAGFQQSYQVKMGTRKIAEL